MREGAATLARLAVPSHPEYRFVFDPSKLSFYAATCYTWLGETERAEEHAREVIGHSIGSGDVVRWPTRLAVARLDLGLVAVQRGQIDEAAGLGVAALRSGRAVISTLAWFVDLDAALMAEHSTQPTVRAFDQQFIARRSTHLDKQAMP